MPQAAAIGGNVPFDGPGADEDFGLEQVTGNPGDRYLFRTAPLRNAALNRAFMHNGAFLRLEDAITHHLDPYSSARTYSPADLPGDLRLLGPVEPVLDRLDPRLRTPIVLTEKGFDDLVDFVRHGLLDPRARPQHLKSLIPSRLPSGRPAMRFES